MASPDTSDDQAKKALLRLLGEGAATGVNWYDPADRRLAGLVGRLSAGDQIWLLRCIAWLRGHEVLGPAAIVAAAELVHARLASGAQGGNRRIIGLVLRHPAHPGALLGYWITVHGKVPKPVQRGVADAVKTLYTPRRVTGMTSPATACGSVTSWRSPIPTRTPPSRRPCSSGCWPSPDPTSPSACPSTTTPPPQNSPTPSPPQPKPANTPSNAPRPRDRPGRRGGHDHQTVSSPRSQASRRDDQAVQSCPACRTPGRPVPGAIRRSTTRSTWAGEWRATTSRTWSPASFAAPS